MADYETDYLVVGAGAVGMAFADTLLSQDDNATVTFVDRHARPGGHWNDAYPFVTLHQPSAFYGIEGVELGTGRIDDSGPNKGYYELAGLSELQAYFETAMRDRFLPTGRVTYLPLTDYSGEGRVRGIFSGEENTIAVRRKTVDSTFYDTSVPATHTPGYDVAEGVRTVIPGKLPDLWMERGAIPQHFTVLGGGKTAMDTVIWLLEAGVKPEAIAWVRPRESWMTNRQYTQPGLEFLPGAARFQRDLFEIGATAETADDLFLWLEEREYVLRIDRDVLPTKFFFATVSPGEVERMRAVEAVIAIGRIERIEPGKLVGRDGTATVPDDSLFIDCTASAVRPRPVTPQFEGDRITLQPLMAPLVTLSASVTGWIEANIEGEAEKNALGTPMQLDGRPEFYPLVILGNAMNRAAWGRHPELSAWLATTRLDPMARTIAQARNENPAMLAPFADIREKAMAAMPNLARLAKIAHEGG
ncbi:FAD/NAD(P)-binding protein [Alteriqipengyuania sp. WL0013]|uniref:NAD(P)-binding protein n=1 Tax=Alteriqipengyuania sp. WL0013 TaxID=3110773 RepID=UPI002C44174E|nr:FAD/NAD(P)-binding protein [Alteriqipengyuania sp. WL0013]MEB3416658.1 FAD/NAD(P)-binding protein [Alteriqipengyuania sp. WL0013]